VTQAAKSIGGVSSKTLINSKDRKLYEFEVATRHTLFKGFALSNESWTKIHARD
jgi:hypothetical protein